MQLWRETPSNPNDTDNSIVVLNWNACELIRYRFTVLGQEISFDDDSFAIG